MFIDERSYIGYYNKYNRKGKTMEVLFKIHRSRIWRIN